MSKFDFVIFSVMHFLVNFPNKNYNFQCLLAILRNTVGSSRVHFPKLLPLRHCGFLINKISEKLFFYLPVDSRDIILKQTCLVAKLRHTYFLKFSWIFQVFMNIAEIVLKKSWIILKFSDLRKFFFLYVSVSKFILAFLYFFF